MPKFAANLSMLFNEHEFLDRFDAAAHAGFKAVEYLFPYAWDAQEIAQRLEKNHLQQALFNMYAGNWEQGERGFAAQPDRIDDFKKYAQQALDYALILKCPKVHVMSGMRRPEFSLEEQERVWIDNIRWVSELFAVHGIQVLIEPLNSYDVPNYFIAHQRQAVELIKRVDRSNVKLQFDYYHAQIMDGDVTRLTKDLWSWIGHIQIASIPTRNEPDVGELNYPHVFKLLDDLGYAGWVGCEYRPANGTEAGLDWVKPWL